MRFVSLPADNRAVTVKYQNIKKVVELNGYIESQFRTRESKRIWKLLPMKEYKTLRDRLDT